MHFFVEGLGGEEVKIPEKEPQKLVAAAPAPEPSYWYSKKYWPTYSLLGVVLFMQFWMMFEIRSLKHSITRLESRDSSFCYSQQSP